MRFIAQEVREIMAELGFRTINEMIGHTEKLESTRAIDHWKTQGLDFSHLFYQPDNAGQEVGRYKQMEQDHGLERRPGQHRPALAVRTGPRTRRVQWKRRLNIKNVNRVVGTIVGSEVTRRYGVAGAARRHDQADI